MNARMHQLVIQPSGAERRALLAERNCIHEACRQARNAARAEIRIYKRLKRKLQEANEKLRGLEPL
jgi:16S rRNA U1498 N3-methylase RsmE